MKMLARALIGASMLVTAAAGQAQIVNGSFEYGSVNPNDYPNDFVTLYNGSTDITGWTVINGARLFSIDYIGDYWQASDGQRSIDLSGNGQGGIYQDVALIPGWYEVTFDAAANPDSQRSLNRVFTFSADATPQGGTSRELFTYAMDGTETRGDMQWQSYRTNRFYSDGTTRISFIGGTVSPFGAALDNVGIDMVPEPATWAMMLIGFGAIGSAVRRRRRTMAVSYA